MRNRLYVFSICLLASLFHARREEVDISGLCADCCLDVENMSEYLTPAQMGDVLALVRHIANGVCIDPETGYRYEVPQMPERRIREILKQLNTEKKTGEFRIEAMDRVETPHDVPEKGYCQFYVDTQQDWRIEFEPAHLVGRSTVHLRDILNIRSVDVYFNHDYYKSHKRFYRGCAMLEQCQFLRVEIKGTPEGATQNFQRRLYVALLGSFTGPWLHKIVENPNPTTRVFPYE